MGIYTNGLDGFSKEDIKAAVAQMCLQERAEGKTAFPSLGEMVTACQAAAKRRFENADRLKEAEESQYRKDHPDEFMSWKELLAEMGAMQNDCLAYYGEGWRSRLSMEFGLCELHAEVMAERALEQ